MTDYEEIEQKRLELVRAQREYLTRYGWKDAGQTPGSPWFWCRELPTFGHVFVPVDLAIEMTREVLEDK